MISPSFDEAEGFGLPVHELGIKYDGAVVRDRAREPSESRGLPSFLSLVIDEGPVDAALARPDDVKISEFSAMEVHIMKVAALDELSKTHVVS